MPAVYPDYYPEFHCIAGACRHSCCIGWEIDIDEDAASYFRALPGAFGDRLRQNIAWEETPHFILTEKERCPFLNGDGLCDMILTLGEESLCGICRDHPRFRNELFDRVEIGLGLCCEEAARLILGRKEPMKLLSDGPLRDDDDEILALRDRIFVTLQKRDTSIPQRVAAMLRLCDAPMPHGDWGAWAELLLSLERLEAVWTDLLTDLIHAPPEDFTAFDAHMEGRETEYEQLLCYLIYRHFSNACTWEDAAARAAFAAFGYLLLRALGAMCYAKTGVFSFEDQCELARLFSAEIEYSDENPDILMAQFSDA